MSSIGAIGSATDIGSTVTSTPNIEQGSKVEQVEKTGTNNEIKDHENQSTSGVAGVGGPEFNINISQTQNIGMSTQDFLQLHNQAKEDPFEILDEVIARLKENTEAAGDAMEAIFEMAKLASGDNLALQILQKTLEAMDETSQR